MSVQEAVYQVMPELWLRKVFPAVVFANSNLPENRYRICLSEDEIKELDENSSIFSNRMLTFLCKLCSPKVKFERKLVFGPMKKCLRMCRL